MPDRNTPGATSRDLTTPAALQEMYVRGGTAPQSQGIVTGTPADWFGPLNPIGPMAPGEVAGRQLDYPVGYNLGVTPRAYDAVSFHEMRALADAYDVLRLVIETRKDQMERLDWKIQPRTLANGDPATSEDDPLIQQVTDFFERPDGENDWGTWLRRLLEDLFVVDAASIYLHRQAGLKSGNGKLLGLELVDGATIKRVIDDWGRTPEPPAPAFQQVLKGLPAVNYTTDDLLYLPRNLRVHKIYGYSPVEQVIMTIDIALRRQLFLRDYFTEGSLPDALCGTPDDWTPKQVQDFQTAFDAMLAGNLAIRRRVKFIPGGVAKTFLATKEPELTGKTDEWLTRIVCFAFSIAPTPFITQVNRATAETAHDAAIEEGLAPIQRWVTRSMNRIIQRGWPGAKVEFAWADDRDVDIAQQMTVLTNYVEKGIYTINEARDVLGMAPEEGGDVLRALTPTGYVLVAINDDAPTAGEQADQKAEQAKQSIQANAQARAAAAAAQPGAQPAAAAPPGGNGKKPAPKPAPKKKGAAGKSAGTFRKGYWSPHRAHPRRP